MYPYHLVRRSAFQLAGDSGEVVNCVDVPKAKPVLAELRAILNRQVDTEAVAKAAFAKQQPMLDHFACKLTKGELADMF